MGRLSSHFSFLSKWSIALGGVALSSLAGATLAQATGPLVDVFFVRVLDHHTAVFGVVTYLPSLTQSGEAARQPNITSLPTGRGSDDLGAAPDVGPRMFATLELTYQPSSRARQRHGGVGMRQPPTLRAVTIPLGNVPTGFSFRTFRFEDLGNEGRWNIVRAAVRGSLSWTRDRQHELEDQYVVDGDELRWSGPVDRLLPNVSSIGDLAREGIAIQSGPTGASISSRNSGSGGCWLSFIGTTETTFATFGPALLRGDYDQEQRTRAALGGYTANPVVGVPVMVGGMQPQLSPVSYQAIRCYVANALPVAQARHP